MSSRGKVSIIIPLFNREKLIGHTIQSVIDQTYGDWECVIVDDGSTDKSLDTVTRFCNDPRILLIERSRMPKGASTCRNIGIEYATGKYLMFLDSDDLLSSKCLENRVKYFEDFPENDFLVFATNFFQKSPGDSNDKWLYLHHNDIKISFLIHAVWQTSGSFWKTEKIKEHRFLEGIKSYQDWEFHLRYLLIFDPVFNIFKNISDVYVRRGESDNLTLRHQEESYLFNRIILYQKVTPLIFEKLENRRLAKNIMAGRYLSLMAKLRNFPNGYKLCLKELNDSIRLSKTKIFLIRAYLSIRNHRVIQNSNLLQRFVRFIFSFLISKQTVFYY